MALGNPTEVISPAIAPIIAAYPSNDVAIVWLYMTSISIQIQMTSRSKIDIIPIVTIIKERDDTPVLFLIIWPK